MAVTALATAAGQTVGLGQEMFQVGLEGGVREGRVGAVSQESERSPTDGVRLQGCP